MAPCLLVHATMFIFLLLSDQIMDSVPGQTELAGSSYITISSTEVQHELEKGEHSKNFCIV